MILQLDFLSEIPIYMQIRNQIVYFIAEGKLSPGKKLPTIRNLANELGINMMTASKAYQLLKQEGYILTDRRSGAVVSHNLPKSGMLSEKLKQELEMVILEAKLNGILKEDILKLCGKIYDRTEWFT